jgi:hypothetical protein
MPRGRVRKRQVRKQGSHVRISLFLSAMVSGTSKAVDGLRTLDVGPVAGRTATSWSGQIRSRRHARDSARARVSADELRRTLAIRYQNRQYLTVPLGILARCQQWIPK